MVCACHINSPRQKLAINSDRNIRRPERVKIGCDHQFEIVVTYDVDAGRVGEVDGCRRQKLQLDPLARQELLLQRGYRVVEHDRAVVDHDDSPTQLLDVARVVRGEKHGRALGVIQLSNVLANALLGDDVEPDSRLVEKQNCRSMQQRADDLASHPLAEAQLPDRNIQQRLDLEALDEVVQALCTLPDPL